MALQSSTSSRGPFDDSSSSTNDFSSLPVMALRNKIVEKILQNRVTLIVGETGCGKSSQVPQFLMEEDMVPVLCTQPRRLAVVAVAKMVAKSLNCELGEEVGYHIGCTKVLSKRSRIVFKTAGVLLEEMRDKGLNALKYKVIILDEVHERSVESDLVLVCIKQFLLKSNDLRLVLMSATADISRYRDYFKELGRGERVEVLAIPSSSQKTVFQRKVLYLEQVTKLLGISPRRSSLANCSESLSYMADAKIKPEEHKLIHDLVLHIDRNEPDIEKSILIFLPTYNSLVQQWLLLKPFHKSFKVHILHRSLDIEQALTAMKICKSHRKVILATNIAESSVTIPKVAFVIDSCRSLQVYWDSQRKSDSSMLVWVSKSQAEQRKGRTGRTCDGEIYRLVPRSFFSKLENYDRPALLRLSLRQQVLHICCAESRAINDPKVLLPKALDPPQPEVVEEALNLLVHMHALEKTYPRGRYEPTFYGRLLACFRISFDASMLVAKFGEIGMLHEGILLGALMDILPLPILLPFGDEHSFKKYVSCYYGSDNYNTNVAVRKEVVFIANLCAFGFWQHVFKDKHRLENLKNLMKLDEMKATMSPIPKIEEEWCSLHHLVQSSLHNVSELYEDMLRHVHQFRPSFLGRNGSLPTYLHPYEFGHTCLLECEPSGKTNELSKEDDHPDSSLENRKCIASPFVASNQFRLNDVVVKFTNIIKEIRIQWMQGIHDNQLGAINHGGSHPNEEAPVCIYFARGSCNMGHNCAFSHSLQAKRPICKFFLSLQGCKNGDSCFFLHDVNQLPSSTRQIACLPEDGHASPASFLQLLPTSSDGCILLLDDTDMRFTLKLIPYLDPSKIISTSRLSERSICDASLTGVRTLWGICHPHQAIIVKVGECRIPWSEIKCVLWYPNLDYYRNDLDSQKILVKNFFEYLAIRILGDALYEVRVIVTMNNIKFSEIQVEKLGRDCFFFLRESFPFDETSFGHLIDGTVVYKSMVVSRATSYVFDLQPPTDIQFGDYASALHNILHDD